MNQEQAEFEHGPPAWCWSEEGEGEIRPATGRPLWNLAGGYGVQSPERQYESFQEMDMMRLGALAVVAIVMLSGCGTETQVSESGPSEPTPSESTPAGPTPKEQPWGPLAVRPPQEVTETALADDVTVQITDECVFQVEDDVHNRQLIVWPADRTRWNDDAGTISYESPDGTVTIADGDRVSITGGNENFESFDTLVASIDWVSPPAQACQTTKFFDVGGLWKEPTS